MYTKIAAGTGAGYINAVVFCPVSIGCLKSNKVVFWGGVELFFSPSFVFFSYDFFTALSLHFFFIPTERIRLVSTSTLVYVRSEPGGLKLVLNFSFERVAIKDWKSS